MVHIDSAVDSTADAATLEWRDDVEPRLSALHDRLADHVELTLDFTPASLPALEAIADDLDEPFVLGVIAYLGETFMRVGGGRWVWRGEPVVVFDPLLELPDLAPRSLLGTGLLPAYERIAVAVATRQAAEPGWEPTKLATLGVDPVPPPPPSDDLRAWLARQRAAFAQWAAGEAGEAGPWDFSPGSLDQLETILRRRLPAEPALAELGAWYLGETLVRGKGATWRSSSGEPGTSAFAGRQWVETPPPADSIAIPSLIVDVLRGPGDAGLLRTVYDDFR